MGNFLQTIINLLQSLLRIGQSKETPTGTTPPDTETHECIVSDIEIPSEQDLDSLPHYTPETMAQSATEFSAQTLDDVSCDIQIRSSAGFVNIRGGPRLEFGVVATTVGGSRFQLQGASERDADGHRWYMIKTPDVSGWVRGDVVVIGEDCLEHTYITEDDLSPPDPVGQPPTQRFSLPANVPLNQGYTRRHRGYDLDTVVGTPIHAVAPGLVIRAIRCTRCEGRSRPNIYPCAGAIYRDEGWGYGYGNFVTVRHDYRMMPPSMRQHMDSKNLTDGFVYILYAHFSELRVGLGDAIKQGQRLGLTGNSGCSSSPHLHFEVRIGRDETIDGRWLDQTPVNPNILFET